MKAEQSKRRCRSFVATCRTVAKVSQLSHGTDAAPEALKNMRWKLATRESLFALLTAKSELGLERGKVPSLSSKTWKDFLEKLRATKPFEVFTFNTLGRHLHPKCFGIEKRIAESKEQH